MICAQPGQFVVDKPIRRRRRRYSAGLTFVELAQEIHRHSAFNLIVGNCITCDNKDDLILIKCKGDTESGVTAVYLPSPSLSLLLCCYSRR
jgi:hypothetical protein